jgi:CheY-like chemotaxis protein
MKTYLILVVDDEESIRVSVKTYLEDAGYIVTTAESGDKAVEIIKKKLFDVIITDLVMDGTNGLEVLKMTKQLHPCTPVMVLTGYASLPTAIEALRLGAFDYMQKPCHKEELLARLRRCIDYLILNRKISVYEKILPVCSVCKKIRDDDSREHGAGIWLEPDIYISRKSEMSISHGYCDECLEERLKREKDTP